MYAGVSGLRTHQSKMDVIGNNIANVNTVGFKKGQMTFQEVFSQTMRGASAPQDGRGGTNPMQVGLGVGVGSINTIHTKGSAQPTDNPTDLMIDGEGFFVVSDDTNFENKYYTRAGNFSLDRDGNLVTADGYKVLGYKFDEDGKATSEIGGIQINKSESVAAIATSKINFKGNLDSRLEENGTHKADTIIKDSLGNSYTITFKFTKVLDSQNDGNTWKMTVDRVTEQSTKKYTEIASGILPGDELEIQFDSNGKVRRIGNNDLKATPAPEFEVLLQGLIRNTV
jgi:flagellar hook protein FlgE